MTPKVTTPPLPHPARSAPRSRRASGRSAAPHRDSGLAAAAVTGSRLAAALGLLAPVTAGCDCLRNTAEQELANRRSRECARGPHDVTLERVDTDGRIRFTYVALHARDRMLACLEAAGRDSARLPPPITSAQQVNSTTRSARVVAAPSSAPIAYRLTSHRAPPKVPAAVRAGSWSRAHRRCKSA